MVDQFLRFLLYQNFTRFADGERSFGFPSSAGKVSEHILNIDPHLFHTLRSENLHHGRFARVDFDFNVSVFELPIFELFSETGTGTLIQLAVVSLIRIKACSALCRGDSRGCTGGPLPYRRNEDIEYFLLYNGLCLLPDPLLDRKSTRLNSSHVASSYAVFCCQKKI